MMAELLTMLMDEGAHTIQQLAERLGVEVDSLNRMIELLVKKGLLKGADCDVSDKSHCAHCPVQLNCSKPEYGQAYYLTDKGKQYAISHSR